MRDIQADIRKYLLSKTALTALVSDRIYAGRESPKVGYKPEEGAAIAFRVRGGAGEFRGRDYEDALVIPSIQFKCYGLSEKDAFEVYRTLVDSLHNGTSSIILHAEETGIGQTLEESDTDWHFILSFFDIVIRSA
jgi:hypothetical protein